MSSLLSTVAGQYTTPAAIVVQPPAGGVLWAVWCHAENAPMLAEDLIDYGVRFGQQTWPDSTDVLIVVFVAMPAPEALRNICARYARPRQWDAALDITGVWEEWRP